MDKRLEKIQEQINEVKEAGMSVGELSDTYHSFNDLYDHRMILSAFAMMNMPYAWKAKTHEDGSMFDGMFVVGAPTPDGMITYHYDLEYWNLFKIPEIPHAPHFDGHTPEDVINRIKSWIINSGTRLVSQDSFNRIEKIVTEYILPVFGDDIVAQAAYIGCYNK